MKRSQGWTMQMIDKFTNDFISSIKGKSGKGGPIRF
jgi:hypothetical protein